MRGRTIKMDDRTDYIASCPMFVFKTTDEVTLERLDVFVSCWEILNSNKVFFSNEPRWFIKPDYAGTIRETIQEYYEAIDELEEQAALKKSGAF
jgi:hypothetical protein